ncbi:hypothetical protein OEZ85_008944 [Tetradesmus obliquus]|uniref:Uncharacterized protein n=1 Tax=Tetradesmus obliquus TaxID=3088 RepID=A0ABY8TKA2_TETOB|nr:hypothetical protein OEZ85_008944 [Tetradesmus obliquus]
MSHRPPSRKVLEAQAKVVAKEDARFVAKLSGQKWKITSSADGLGAGNSISKPAAPQQPPVQSQQQQQTGTAGSTAAALQETGTPGPHQQDAPAAAFRSVSAPASKAAGRQQAALSPVSQASVQCVERGRLLAQLWLALRSMLLAALHDRHSACASEDAAHAAAAAAASEVSRLQQQQEDERVALRAISERHAAKAEAAKQELAQCQKKNDQARGSSAEQQLCEAQQQLLVSTPRPKRDLGLLADLLTAGEAQLVEQALIAGVPAEHVHRLLLGLSLDGDDLRPWLGLAGCCSAALKAAADPARLHQQLKQLVANCDAAAAHMPAGSKDAAVKGRGSSGKAAGASAAASSTSADCSSSSNLKDTNRVVELLATVGIAMPYLPLVGVLASKYGHDASELGGPVTEALQQAQLSTRARVQDLEGRTKAMHREVVLLKRSLADARKQEAERIEAALRDQKRKIARRQARQPSLLDKFLQTKCGDYFMGIGLMDEVPRALRANVPINNKRMSKRDAEKLAREIWAAKDEAEAAGAPRAHLADVTATFLERRYFAIPRLVTEVAYNFVYSLGQHSYDADCNLFLRVFSGDVEEAVRGEQQALEGEIMRLLKLLDVSINHQATGWLHKADVKTALAGFFKGKSVDRLAELFEALDTDEPGEALRYPGLFSDDDEMNQGMTAETIRSQHLAERLEYLQELEDSIRDGAEDNETTSLTPAMLRSCLEKVSRKLDPATLDSLVSLAFGPEWQQQQQRLAQPLGAVIRAIRRGSLQPALRPSAATAATAEVQLQAVRVAPQLQGMRLGEVQLALAGCSAAQLEQMPNAA